MKALPQFNKSNSFSRQLLLCEGRAKFVLNPRSSFEPTSKYDIIPTDDIAFVICPLSTNREESKCSICLSEDMIVPRLLECGHFFCAMCIELAQRYSNQCPTCHRLLSPETFLTVVWAQSDNVWFDHFDPIAEAHDSSAFTPLFLFRNRTKYLFPEPVSSKCDLGVQYRRILRDEENIHIPAAAHVTLLDLFSLCNSLRYDCSTQSLDKYRLCLYVRLMIQLLNKLDGQFDNRRGSASIGLASEKLDNVFNKNLLGSEIDDGRPLSRDQIDVNKSINDLVNGGGLGDLLPTLQLGHEIWKSEMLLPILLQIFPDQYGEALECEFSCLLKIITPEVNCELMRLISADEVNRISRYVDDRFKSLLKAPEGEASREREIPPNHVDTLSKFLRKKRRLDYLLLHWSYRSVPDMNEYPCTLFRSTVAPIVVEAFVRHFFRSTPDHITQDFDDTDDFLHFLESEWPPPLDEIERFLPELIFPCLSCSI
eukprot:GHVH01001848.1.p1 GENE.GHVH01001848.1~~GHVH01001848.1.p1  ORF type:complete len:533 (-),score=61.47 GHVH01001848.1:1196-2641(-)